MLNLQDPATMIPRLAKTLPPFPRIVLQVLDLLRSEEPSLQELARVARNDALIVANILATANRIRRMRAESDLTDPFAAASLIGLDRLRSIVVSVGMNRFLAKDQGSEFLFQHSLAVAIVSQELAAMCGVSPEKAYVAGILHDVGQLCFHVLGPERFQAIYRQSAQDGRLLEREAETFGMDHTQIGALLAQHWNLPDEFSQAIANHHRTDSVTCPLQAIVSLSESLVRALDIPPSPKNRVAYVNEAALATLGLDWDTPEMHDCFGRSRARFANAMK